MKRGNARDHDERGGWWQRRVSSWDRRESKNSGRRSLSRSERKHLAQQPKRIRNCRYGSTCKRLDCWFRHPHGRRIDQRTLRQGETSGTHGGARSRSRRGRRSSPRGRRYSPSPMCTRGSPQRSPRRSAESLPRPKSPEPSPPSEQAADPSCFREFVRRELTDGVSGAEAVRLYEEFTRGIDERRLDAFRRTALFFDLYHPLADLWRFDVRSGFSCRAALAFVHALAKHEFAGCHMRAPSLPPHSNTPASNPVCEVLGDGQAPHYIEDPCAHSVVIRSLPPDVSVKEVHEILQGCQGFRAAAWVGRRGWSSDHAAADGDLTREWRARFADVADARAALTVLTSARLGTSDAPIKASLQKRMTHLTAMLLPPEMSSPSRIEKDQTLSASVIRRLDSLVGVRPEITDAVLGLRGTMEEKLDLQILYLRRVHHFCFYSAVWCEDAWELKEACGLALLRSRACTDAAESPSESGWAALHDQRLVDFLASATLKRPMVLESSDAGITQELTNVSEENIIKVDEGRFKCRQCGKQFKGADFVRKHLQKAHVELFQDIFRALHLEQACQAYDADPNKLQSSKLACLL